MKLTVINSQGHWKHGWFSSPTDLEKALKILNRAGLELQSIEVASLYQLEKALDQIPTDTLIWSNAYFVNDDNRKPVWLNERLEARNLPIIGSGTQTLQRVLRKDECQAILAEHGLPVPAFAVINRKNVGDIEEIVAASIEPPFVLKPTCESGSCGVCKVDTLAGVKESAMRILQDFPHSDVIVEEYLPSNDITCGYIEMGDEFMLLPTTYIVKSATNNILARHERLLLWGEKEEKFQPIITDPAILAQLVEKIPNVVEALDIQDITRIDGRLDREGNLRFFDVNGLPALCFPESVMVQQCFSCFPDYSHQTVYEGLLYTIVCLTLLKHGMEVPATMLRNNLFQMESDAVVRCAKILATN